MCTALLSCVNGNADHIRQRIALAVVGLSPIERQVAFKVERGWKNLPIYADVNGSLARTTTASRTTDRYGRLQRLHAPRRTIRHFWGAELGFESAIPARIRLLSPT